MKNIFLLGNINVDFFWNIVRATLALNNFNIYIFSKEQVDSQFFFGRKLKTKQALTHEGMFLELAKANITSNDMVIALDAIEYGPYLQKLNNNILKMLVFTGKDSRFNRKRFLNSSESLDVSLKSANVFGFLSKENMQEMLHMLTDKPAILLPYGYSFANEKDSLDSIRGLRNPYGADYPESRNILVIDDGNINYTIDSIKRLSSNLTGLVQFHVISESDYNNTDLVRSNINLINYNEWNSSPMDYSIDLVISFETNSELKLARQLIKYDIPIFLIFHPFNLTFEHQSSIFLFSDMHSLVGKINSYFEAIKDTINKVSYYRDSYLELHSQDNLEKKIRDIYKRYCENNFIPYYEDLSFNTDYKDIAVFYYGAEIESTRLSARPMRVRAMQYNINLQTPCLNIIGSKATILRKINYLERVLVSKNLNVSFFYEESLSVQPKIDATLINSTLRIKRLINKYSLPYGVFLRDIYQGYLELYELRPDRATIMYEYMVEEFNLNAQIAEKIFVPSPTFARESIFRGIVPKEYEDKFEILPPAIDTRLSVFSSNYIAGSQDLIKIAYSGGLGRFYDFKKFVEALKICKELPIQFDMYVRKNELLASKDIYGNLQEVENIYIYEGSFTDLASNKFYDLGLCLFDSNLYRQMAAPVKLFDYLSLGIPVLVGKGSFAEDIVQSDDVGFCIDYTVGDIVNLLISLVENRQLLNKKQSNIENFIDKNRWKDRSDLVVKCLKKTS